jgi:hypothetical protein
MSPVDIDPSLRHVFGTLQKLQAAETAGTGVELTQTVSVQVKQCIAFYYRPLLRNTVN